MRTLYLLLFAVTFYGKLNAQNPVFNWSAAWGGDFHDVPKAVAVDDSGYIYTVGQFRGAVDFDPGPAVVSLSSVGYADIFITKTSPQNTLVWAKKIGGADNDDYPAALTIVGGKLYFSGMVVGWVDFDPGPGVMNLWGGFSATMFFSRWDLNGNMELAKTFDGSPNAMQGMAADKKGNIYLTGGFGYTTDFDPGPGTHNVTTSGGTDAFICKMDSVGNLVWVRPFTGFSQEYGTSIGVDSQGNVYASGTFNGTSIDFPNTPTPWSVFTNGDADIFLVKYDSTGSFVWAQSIGGGSSDEAYSMRVDEAGNTYMITRYGSFSAFPQYFVFKHDAMGNLYYKTWVPDAYANIEGEGLAIDKYGAAYVTGNAIFSVNTHFLEKIDAFGWPLWRADWGGNGNGMSMSVAVDTSLNIYTVGVFLDTADLDPGPGVYPAVSTGGQDMYLTSFGQCVVTTTISDTICYDSAMVSGPIYNTSGTYFIGYNGTLGCDSFVIRHVTVPNHGVSVNGGTITSAQSGATYQWIDCSTMQAVPGATSQSFTPVTPGSYAVVLMLSSCTDTSACVPVVPSGIGEVSKASGLRIVPNPVANAVEVSTGSVWKEATVRIRDAFGNTLLEEHRVSGRARTLDLFSHPPGLYFIEIQDGNMMWSGKLLKQ
jgi:hypothetical protein